jgi:hypothetical protein
MEGDARDERADEAGIGVGGIDPVLGERDGRGGDGRVRLERGSDVVSQLRRSVLCSRKADEW